MILEDLNVFKINKSALSIHTILLNEVAITGVMQTKANTMYNQDLASKAYIMLNLKYVKTFNEPNSN